MFKAENLNIINKANKMVFTNNISFTIESSEIWRFRGPNGIGKSSVYESLIGIRPIYQGAIFLNNINLNNLTPSKRIKLGLKYVSQRNALFDNISIKANLELCAEYLLPYKKRKEAVDNAIKMFQLEDLALKTPAQLSGGQQRIAELAKIMIGPAHLVLMDEPFAAIDLNMIKTISNIFLQLKENGYSFFINDHNLKAVEDIANKDLIVSATSTTIKQINNDLLSKSIKIPKPKKTD